jgi:hypothetical protein
VGFDVARTGIASVGFMYVFPFFPSLFFPSLPSFPLASSFFPNVKERLIETRTLYSGFPSVGKSSLMTGLTGTESVAAAYEFSTSLFLLFPSPLSSSTYLPLPQRPSRRTPPPSLHLSPRPSDPDFLLPLRLAVSPEPFRCTARRFRSSICLVSLREQRTERDVVDKLSPVRLPLPPFPLSPTFSFPQTSRRTAHSGFTTHSRSNL